MHIANLLLNVFFGVSIQPKLAIIFPNLLQKKNIVQNNFGTILDTGHVMIYLISLYLLYWKFVSII